MTVAEHLPRARRTGTGLYVVAVVIVAVIAVAGLLRGVHDRTELRAVHSMAAQSAQDVVANADAVREANSKLEAAGVKPVKIPVPGPVGQPGAAGAAGTAGAAGVQGIPGRDGAPGANGVNGVNGHDGGTGTSGADGQTVTGPQGAAGPAGADGKDGTDGADGSDGRDGQAPVSWSYTNELGVPMTCTRTDPFDPTAPTYTCAADAP